MRSSRSPLLLVLCVVFIGGLACSRDAPPELTWQFAYDASGRLTTMIDPAGHTTHLQYDLDDLGQVRRLTKGFPDASSVTLTFDTFGRRVAMADATGLVRYSWDGYNRLTHVAHDGRPLLAYAYDTQGRVHTLECGNLRTQYAYDFASRLAAIDTAGGRITYAYQARRTLRELPNGIRTLWEVDEQGRLASISHATSTNALLARFAYAYDADGHLTTITEWAPSGETVVRFTRDTAGRLASITAGQAHYHYDAMGHLLRWSPASDAPIDSVYDWAGRLLQHGRQAASADAAGNVVAYMRDQTPVQFTYAAASALASVRTGHTAIDFTYDGDGKISARTDGTGETRYVSDALYTAWRPLLALHADGLRQWYVWEPAGVVVAAIAEAEGQFFLHDHQGSVRLITDRAGNLVQRVDYTPTGTPHGPLPHGLSGGGFQPAVASLFYDPAAGVYVTPAGAYDPRLGRVLQHTGQLARHQAWATAGQP